jgi:transcription initiation factor TFIID subunit TAF12
MDLRFRQTYVKLTTTFGARKALKRQKTLPGADQMNVTGQLVMMLMALSMAAAHAKLPAPTPEEQAAAAQKKAAQQAQLEKEKQQLEAAQDRVVQHYRKEKGGAPAAGGASRKDTDDMPKTAKELPAGVGPQPTQPQSAEAHSAPAK